MSRLDLVIFGATGYTGKHAVKEMVRIAKDYPGISWAIAGRSRDKLKSTLHWVSAQVGEDVSSVHTILAAVEDESSLHAMCFQTKVLVNCCGPYRLYGEPVVRAAIDCQTHYVDVCGEPQFMETMQVAYDKIAREAGVFVISACGFDSIPADYGVVYLEQRFEGTLNSVECYLSSAPAKNYSGSMVNYGTWESLVYSLEHMDELPLLRQMLFPGRLPPLTPKLKPRRTVHWRDGKWCLPLPTADASVVYRTQRGLFYHEEKRPVQFKSYAKLGSLFNVFVTLFVSSIIFVMCKFSFTRRLLLDYPRIFTLGMVSKESPTEEATNVPFTFELYGNGWPVDSDIETDEPAKELLAKVSGVNPGYGATVVAVLFSAITIITEQDKMPDLYGVMTPGVAFRYTNLDKRLNENGLIFEIVN